MREANGRPAKRSQITVGDGDEIPTDLQITLEEEGEVERAEEIQVSTEIANSPSGSDMEKESEGSDEFMEEKACQCRGKDVLRLV